MFNKYFPKKMLYLVTFILLLSCSSTPNATDTKIVIPFAIEQRKIVLDAAVNGSAGKYFWDSGANFSVVSGMRYRFTRNPTMLPVQGAGVTVPFFDVKSLRFGGVEVKSLLAVKQVEVKSPSLAARQSDFPMRTVSYLGLQGMLSNIVFGGFWVELSFSRNEIVLHSEKPVHFANAKHAELKLQQGEQAHGLFYLPIDIDGKEFCFLIDTGLPHAFFFPSAITSNKKPDDLRQIASNLEYGDHFLVKTNSVSFLDRTYNDRSIMTNSYVPMRWTGNYDVGIIGLEFFEHYDLLIDYRGLYDNTMTEGMYYIPITPPDDRNYGFYSFLTEAPEFGIINFYYHRRGLEITCILTDSPAYETYGLRPGSIISKINGEPARNFTIADMLDPQFFRGLTDFSIWLTGRGEELILVQSE